jgi:hypothetical protein
MPEINAKGNSRLRAFISIPPAGPCFVPVAAFSDFGFRRRLLSFTLSLLDEVAWDGKRKQNDKPVSAAYIKGNKRVNTGSRDLSNQPGI